MKLIGFKLQTLSRSRVIRLRLSGRLAESGGLGLNLQHTKRKAVRTTPKFCLEQRQYANQRDAQLRPDDDGSRLRHRGRRQHRSVTDSWPRKVGIPFCFRANSGLPVRGVRRMSVVIGEAVSPHACVDPPPSSMPRLPACTTCQAKDPGNN